MALSTLDKKAQIAAASRGNRRALDLVMRDGFTAEGTTATAATVALTRTANAGVVTLLSRAAGQAVTLPAATGSGDTYRLLITTTITSNSTTIKVANSSDTMVGVVVTATTTTGAGTHEAAGGTDDTITLNGTTTGGIAGSYVELTDVASTLWMVTGRLVGSGTLATPLSATV